MAIRQMTATLVPRKSIATLMTMPVAASHRREDQPHLRWEAVQ